MTQIDELLRLLQGPAPEALLCQFVKSSAAKGMSQSELYLLLDSVLLKVRKQDGAENAEEAVLSVMDAVTGWCHPSARIFPEIAPGNPIGGGSQ